MTEVSSEQHKVSVSSTKMTEDEVYVLHRRFDRMGRLVGDDAMARLMSSHVMVVGLGGVGSWAAESLIRSGVGRVTLVDFDAICITNTNRQLHAMHGMVGKKKVFAMAERLQKINPKSEVVAIDQFYNKEHADEILSHGPDMIIDAIDNLTAKCHLLATCVQRKIPVFSSGGSGGRIDPQMLTTADMSETYRDPLAANVRRILRQEYAFPRTGPMGIPCVFSKEEPIEPEILHYDGGKGFRCVCPMGKNEFHTCDKRSVIHGTASFVTGSFGFALAGLVVRHIAQQTEVRAD